MINAGDVVANRLGRTGIVRAVDRDADDYTVFWFNVGAGAGWRTSDLSLVRTAADEAARRARVDARKAADMHRATIARVRAAAGLPDWHADEVDAEIARVRAAVDLPAYRTASREGSKTPLGAKQKTAIWNVLN